MDGSSPCRDLLSEHLRSPHDLMQSYVSHKQHSFTKNCTIEDSEVTELGTALSRILNVQGVPLPVPGCIQSSSWIEICNLGMCKVCEEFEVQNDKFSTESTQKVLNKCFSFPISSKLPSCPVSMDAIEGTTCTKVHENDSSQNRVCSRSLSLPNPPIVRSAIKGGREKQGVPPLGKLTVKWAPDVYDPPSSTVSHTVKSHNQQQRSSSRSNNKKQSKHKHKGKSSRGNNNTDKKQHRKSI